MKKTIMQLYLDLEKIETMRNMIDYQVWAHPETENHKQSEVIYKDLNDFLELRVTGDEDKENLNDEVERLLEYESVINKIRIKNGD